MSVEPNPVRIGPAENRTGTSGGSVHHPVNRSRFRPIRPRRRRPTRPAGLIVRATARPLSDAERQRRLDRLARYLVRTVNACPAPGIAPFTTRDWLLLATAAILPYLLVFGLASIARAR